MFTKGQSGELAWVTSSNIPSPLKWFLGPFSDFASSLKDVRSYPDIFIFTFNTNRTFLRLSGGIYPVYQMCVRVKSYVNHRDNGKHATSTVVIYLVKPETFLG